MGLGLLSSKPLKPALAPVQMTYTIILFSVSEIKPTYHIAIKIMLKMNQPCRSFNEKSINSIKLAMIYKLWRITSAAIATELAEALI